MQVKQAQFTTAEALLDLEKSRKSIYPNLNVQIGGNVNFGRTLDPTTNLYITQNALSSTESVASTVQLFHAFQKLDQIKQNKFIVEADRSNIEKLKDDLLIQVATDYLAALNYQRQLLAAIQLDSISLQQLDLNVKKEAVGRLQMTEVMKAREQVAKSEMNIATIENQLNLTLTDLKLQMNADAATTINLVEPKANIKEISQAAARAFKGLPPASRWWRPRA